MGSSFWLLHLKFLFSFCKGFVMNCTQTGHDFQINYDYKMINRCITELKEE